MNKAQEMRKIAETKAEELKDMEIGRALMIIRKAAEEDGKTSCLMQTDYFTHLEEELKLRGFKVEKVTWFSPGNWMQIFW